MSRRASSPQPFVVQDPLSVLRQMGCSELYDFRAMDYNLIPDVMSGAILLGSSLVTNGGFEAPYTAGVANNWVKGVGATTGVFSEETVLPWTSLGTSAQKVVGNTDYNVVLLSQAETIVAQQTYKLRFKIRVDSGSVRVRVFTPATWGERDFTSADGAIEAFFYLGTLATTAVSIQIVNIAVDSCSFIIDDLELEPVSNDKGAFFPANLFATASFDKRGYLFSGSQYAINYNRLAQITVADDFCVSTLVHPTTPGLTISSIWQPSVSRKSYIASVFSPTKFPMFYWSNNGTSAFSFQVNHDSYTPNKNQCFQYDYGLVASNYYINVDGADKTPLTAPTRTAVFQPQATFCIGAHPSPTDTFIEPFVGRISCVAHFKRFLTLPEKRLISALMLNLRK